MVRIRYVGGRPNAKEVWNRIRYIFSKENDFTCEVPGELEQWLAQHAVGQYQVMQDKIVIKEVVKEVERPMNLKCDICGFTAKTGHGLTIHSYRHTKGRK